jgi:hypothetical protein
MHREIVAEEAYPARRRLCSAGDPLRVTVLVGTTVKRSSAIAALIAAVF